MKNFSKGFVASLAFLTRLAPGAKVDEPELARAMSWMPVVGAILGLICVGPLWLFVPGTHPFIQAWLCVMLSIYLTRALHLDGLSDVMDGLAAHLDADRFWEITKDSRVGAFGVIGLSMALIGLILLLGELFMAGLYGQVLWAFIVGRFCALILGHFGRHLSRPGLGSLFLAGATLPAMLAGLFFTLATGLLLASPAQILGAFIAVAPFQVALFCLAKKVKGLNGDFLGASIITGELGTLLGILIAS